MYVDLKSILHPLSPVLAADKHHHLHSIKDRESGLSAYGHDDCLLMLLYLLDPNCMLP
jgi:hypothetical protein